MAAWWVEGSARRYWLVEVAGSKRWWIVGWDWG
jgi:hypothetical protein